MERQRYEKLHEIWQIERYRNLSPFYITRKRIIRRLVLETANGGTHILDVGCGMGDLLSMFGKHLDVSVGIDLSLTALKTASGRFKSASFLLADATAIPLRQDCFHIAVCSEVLEHLERDYQGVAEISRVLRKDGFAVFTVPQNPKYWTMEDSFDGHLRRYNAHDFAYMLKDQRLDIVELLSWGFPLAFLFRSYFSTRLFNARLHEPLTTGKARLVKTMAKLLSYIFRFDDLFNKLNLGLGIAAVARKL